MDGPISSSVFIGMLRHMQTSPLETPQGKLPEYLNTSSEEYLQSLRVQARIFGDRKDYDMMDVWAKRYREIFNDPAEATFRQWVKDNDLDAVKHRVDHDLHLPHAA
jgi:hypothetical protein